MTTKNKRIKALALTTRIEFDVHADAIATMTTSLRKLEAERDAKIQIAQQTNAGAIAELQELINAKATLCEKYAEAHRDELLPGKAKSAETPLVTFGFRTGNHTLKTLSKWTWAKVLDALTGRHLVDCIRSKPEVNKEGIIAEAKETGVLVLRDDDSGAEIEIPLREVGLKIEQEEVFFIDPKVAGAAAVKAEAVA